MLRHAPVFVELRSTALLVALGRVSKSSLSTLAESVAFAAEPDSFLDDSELLL